MTFGYDVMAAPLPARRRAFAPDRPLRGPSASTKLSRQREKGVDVFVEARLRSAAMPFPRRHHRSRNGLDDRVPDLAS